MKFHEMIKLEVLNETDFITTNDGFSLSTVSIANPNFDTPAFFAIFEVLYLLAGLGEKKWEEKVT